MPYCPKCRDEFQHWVRVCPDCEAALVEQLPVQSKREETDEPLVYIATALNESVASMWSGILEEHGIHCLLKSANLRAAMYAFTYNMTCRIHVLASEAERAKEMLSPFLKADTEKEV
ncbi:MAG: putative signal transducing protein [Dehalococcoidia bacterium]